MAVTFPAGKLRLLGKQTQPKMSSHDIICLHTMVGYLASTDSMFRSSGFSGVESHFGVGGAWGSDVAQNLDGVVYQWQDPTFTADANLNGNHRVISIETADNAPKSASDIKPWTPKQLDSIVELVAWLCHTYDIPVALIADTKPGRRGIAYHRQGIDPWRVSGGELWSNSRGKECPGDVRIAQIKNVIIPRVKSKLEVASVALSKADAELIVETFFEHQQKLTEADAVEMSSAGTKRTTGEKVSTEFLFKWGGPGVYRLYRLFMGMQKDIASLKTQLAALAAKK